jgi:DNA polymerase III delta prime subunit
MLKRPHTFDDIIGHEVFKKYFIERIKRGTLPQFIVLEGPEGLGKTSIAEVIAITVNYGFDDSPQKTKAIQEVIDNRHSIDCIKKFNMAKDSGKDTAKEVLAELSPSMSTTGRKVVICDESHAIVESAQDVFLVETEYIPKNTYLIMCTTDKSKLKATLLSRAVCIPLSALTTSQMVQVLKKEAASRNLTIQGGDIMLRIIAEWADNKPRAALNILNAFGENDVVSTEMVREFIGSMDISEILPLVTSLAGSLTYGLTFISEMKFSDGLVDSLVEVLRIKMGQPSYKVSLEQYQDAKRKLENVPEEAIMKLLHSVAGAPKLNRATMVSAYISAHMSYKRIFNSGREVLVEEQTQKLASRSLAPDVKSHEHIKAPTLDDMLANSNPIGGF